MLNSFICISESTTIDFGIPQGSTLGLLHFILYIKGIIPIDDIIIYICEANTQYLFNILNKELDFNNKLIKIKY